MKKYHLSVIDLSFRCATGETQIERQKEAKREEKTSKQGRKFLQPSPSHSSDPQVHFKSIACVHHVHEVT